MNILLLILGLLFLFLLGLLVLKNKLDFINEKLQNFLNSSFDFKSMIDNNFSKNREENLNLSLKMGELLGNNISNLTDKLDKLKDDVVNKLLFIQQDNAVQLDKIREVVDEKLQKTLEQKLGMSFKLVSERLDLVHKGLGEMQTLAQGVGDLKKVLTNVKLRGTWGEIQLRNILSQLLSPEQFIENVQIKANSNERVEFAIKLPTTTDEMVLLPIDSKFPIEDYQKLLDEEDKNATKQLVTRIKLEAKSILEKYISPPKTTDFAIMFLPTEGLYAEVLRAPGLFEYLQNNCRVIVAGPLTLTAILNSIQLGFKTLTIHKRSSEVINIFREIKSEFVKFGVLLEKTHKKILEAGNVIEIASKKSRTIEKRLDTVENSYDEKIEDAELENISDI